MYIDQHEIFEKTNGGLDIILSYYQEAKKAVEKNGAKFSIRPEKTPSCTLRQLKDGVYVLTDFGDDSKPKNGIHITMEQEGLDFKEAIQYVGERFKIVGTSEKYKAPEALISDRPAKPEENEKEWYFEVRDGFTELEVKTILSKNVIPYGKRTESGERPIDFEKVQKVFRKYNFYALKSYSIVKNRKVTTITATDEYPIFMWDEANFKKIYQPLSKDKGLRFMYYGKMDQDFLFGLSECRKAFTDLEEDVDPDQLDENGDPLDKKKKKKLQSIIYCTGGSDAMNIAFGIGGFRDNAHPFQVCWGNSETAKLTNKQFREMSKMATKVMQCPDLDQTGQKEGHRLALEYLDLHTIVLPPDLMKQKDRRGNNCKDVRDYLNHFNFYEFNKLVETALPYRFWEMEAKFDRKGEYKGVGYVADPVQLYNFLQKNGFNQFETEGEKSGNMFIHVTNNIVEETTGMKIKNWIHRYLQENYFEKDLRNIFYKSNLLAENSLTNLQVVNLDMDTFGPHHQYFFFSNKIIKVDNKEVLEFKPGQIAQNVWKEEVIEHHFKIQTPHFKLTARDKKNFNIEILKKDNKFLNYLINTSRVHWRKELETSLENLSEEEAADYREKHKFDIAGPNLDTEDQGEQMQHLVNKMYSLGYLLHRYKNSSRPWAVFAMDNRVGDEGESNGGSGKSIAYNSLFRFMKSHYLGGRSPKLTDNAHIYEGITKHTYFVLVDDCHQYLNFHFFFDVITGKMKVNPKNTKQYTLDFHEVPKFAFTSNFTIRNIDSSAERRLLYTVFSDYYHHSKDGFYKEHRTPEDDFGKKIIDDDYTQEEWNDFYNFMIQCCQLYLEHQKIGPPMSNVEKRNLLGIMGEEFKEWADVYFSPESGNLDTLVIKPATFDDFKNNNKTLMKAQRFTKALAAWCKFNNYILNPSSLGLNDPLGRIIQRGDYMGQNKTLERIYIQTHNDHIQPPLNEDGKPKMPEPTAKGMLDELPEDELKF